MSISSNRSIDFRVAALLSLLSFPLPTLVAEEPKPNNIVALSVEQAGPDFALQGEYEGMIDTGDGRVKLGIQVIALGDGQFVAQATTGGLPGAGWNGEERIEVRGTRQGESIVFSSDGGDGIVQAGKITIVNVEGETMGVLEKVNRKSPTLGMKPPEGAVVLFDGKTADQFENGRLSEDGLLMQGTTSKHRFQDARVHLEFLLSFMPQSRGQGRSNSGCYLQGRYEVQILDSFGLTGEHNECGGIYSVAKPRVNLCFPPLSWQTYDIDFTAAKFDESGKKIADARMTVRQNGVLIHENVTVDHATTASPLQEGPEPGPLYLQDHGNPVRFRNIWIAPLE